MPEVQTSEPSLDPCTALAEQRETSIEKAVALKDFSDIAKVNAVFVKEGWSIEKKVNLLVRLAKNVTKKPGIAMAAMRMLDKTWEDAIARSELRPKETKVPPPGSTAEQLGMPSLRDIESIEQTTQTVRANFIKENLNAAQELQSAEETPGDTLPTIDIDGTSTLDRGSDASPAGGDVEPGVGGDSGGGTGGPEPATATEPDPDSEAYFQDDDRGDGEIHRAPAEGSYGVRTGSI